MLEFIQASTVASDYIKNLSAQKGSRLQRAHKRLVCKPNPENPSIQIIPIMENQMEEKMENQMESGVIKGVYRDPSIQMIPTLGPKVCTHYQNWAIWIPRETFMKNLQLVQQEPTQPSRLHPLTPG